MASRDEKRARREQAAALREEQARKDRRSRNVRTVGIVVVVVLVLVGAATLLTKIVDGDDDLAATSTPTGLTDGGVLVEPSDLGGQDTPDPVRVTVFEDFGCPHCKDFEAEQGAWLDRQVRDGKIELLFRPVAFLSDYSDRAMAASMCVLDASDVATYRDYARELFAKQADEPDTEELATIATQVGATDASECIAGQPYRDWVKTATDEAFDQPDADGTKVKGTPTVWVDGRTVSGPTRDGQRTVARVVDIEKAIQAAS